MRSLVTFHCSRHVLRSGRHLSTPAPSAQILAWVENCNSGCHLPFITWYSFLKRQDVQVKWLAVRKGHVGGISHHISSLYTHGCSSPHIGQSTLGNGVMSVFSSVPVWKSTCSCVLRHGRFLFDCYWRTSSKTCTICMGPVGLTLCLLPGSSSKLCCFSWGIS